MLRPKFGAFIFAWLVALNSVGADAQTSDLVSKSALRVCADPANPPMSDKDGSGFENKIAQFFAQKLNLPLEYTWYPMSTGFIRNTLSAFKCDLVIGYTQGHERVLNTNHYMVSAYALVVPSKGPLSEVTTLSDPALHQRRIRVIAGSPPVTHMARHGLMASAKGYSLFVDSRFETPVLDMLADLHAGKIEAAVLWGPLAGPIIKQKYSEMQLTLLLIEALPPRMFFRITMGVRQGERVWKRKLNALIRRNQPEIDQILREAGVPLVTDMGTGLKPINP